MKESFICPHCKNITGWREVIPVHGHYTEHYDENGKFEAGAYADSMNYYEKSYVRQWWTRKEKQIMRTFKITLQRFLF